MAFPASLTRRSEDRSAHLLLSRLVAFLQAPTLDAELGAGIRPSISSAHRLRADHLRRERVRRRVARALNKAVEDARLPVPRGTAKAPLDSAAVRCCHREIRDLANRLATLENPRTQGIAIAFRLAFDGGSALFFHPDTPDGIERLANTVQAAHNALRVSGEFE